MRKLFVFLTICLIVVGTAGVWHTFNGYWDGQEEYAELQEHYVTKSKETNDTAEQNQSDVSVLNIEETGRILRWETADSLPDDAPDPSAIDFDGLKKMNEDIIGWIEIPVIQVSYPVLHAADNDYYLHRDLNGNDLFAGSIFLDCNNDPDFGDPNSVIYGHNMRDGTMFAKLADLGNAEVLNECPYFWIYTDTENYLYRIISVKRTSNESSCYQLRFADDSAYQDWILEMIRSGETDCSESEELSNISGTVVTLSTCTDSSLLKQVVQGIKTASVARKQP